MEDKEAFVAYIKEGIEYFDKGEFGRSIDLFSAANYVNQNQTPYYWMAKARYLEGDVWRALYNFYLGLCYFQENPELVTRKQIKDAIRDIEPELSIKSPQSILSWDKMKKDPRFIKN